MAANTRFVNKISIIVCLVVCVIAPGHGANTLLKPTPFPKTINDVPVAERRNNQTIGLAPFKDTKAYAQIQFQIQQLEAQSQIDKQTLSNDDYCKKYPLDAENCAQTPGLYDQIVAIGDAPTASQQPGTYDNRTHGGQCTPSDHSDNFVNKILTSGKYEKIDPAFEKAMVQIFRMEGGCSDDPDDKGGFTCYGFSQKNNPDIDVSKLTPPWPRTEHIPNITRITILINCRIRSGAMYYAASSVPDFMAPDYCSERWA